MYHPWRNSFPVPEQRRLHRIQGSEKGGGQTPFTENLPKWTNAFSQADTASAVLVTPNGEIQIGLETKADPALGTIDWHMSFPDGSQSSVYSRLTENGADATVYSFVLMAPPAPLEELEGALAMQKAILTSELQALAQLFDK